MPKRLVPCDRCGQPAQRKVVSRVETHKGRIYYKCERCDRRVCWEDELPAAGQSHSGANTAPVSSGMGHEPAVDPPVRRPRQRDAPRALPQQPQQHYDEQQDVPHPVVQEHPDPGQNLAPEAEPLRMEPDPAQHYHPQGEHNLDPGSSSEDDVQLIGERTASAAAAEDGLGLGMLGGDVGAGAGGSGGGGSAPGHAPGVQFAPDTPESPGGSMLQQQGRPHAAGGVSSAAPAGGPGGVGVNKRKAGQAFGGAWDEGGLLPSDEPPAKRLVPVGSPEAKHAYPGGRGGPAAPRQAGTSGLFTARRLASRTAPLEEGHTSAAAAPPWTGYAAQAAPGPGPAAARAGGAGAGLFDARRAADVHPAPYYVGHGDEGAADGGGGNPEAEQALRAEVAHLSEVLVETSAQLHAERHQAEKQAARAQRAAEAGEALRAEVARLKQSLAAATSQLQAEKARADREAAAARAAHDGGEVAHLRSALAAATKQVQVEKHRADKQTATLTCVQARVAELEARAKEMEASLARSAVSERALKDRLTAQMKLNQNLQQQVQQLQHQGPAGRGGPGQGKAQDQEASSAQARRAPPPQQQQQQAGAQEARAAAGGAYAGGPQQWHQPGSAAWEAEFDRWAHQYQTQYQVRAPQDFLRQQFMLHQQQRAQAAGQGVPHAPTSGPAPRYAYASAGGGQQPQPNGYAQSHPQQPPQPPPQQQQPPPQQQQQPAASVPFAASLPPQLDDSTPVRAIKQFLVEAGAEAQTRLCAEKGDLLALAREKLNAWEIRRAVACARMAHRTAGDCALFRLQPDTPSDRSALTRSYRDMLLRLHPDKNPGDDQATPAFQYLQQAYQRLVALLDGQPGAPA